MSKSSRLWATLFLSTVASVAVVLRQVDTVHAMQGSEGANWVGYSALDVETMSTIDAAGKQTEKLTVIEEFRSSDGFLLTIIKSNGPRVRGLADGRQFSLDYANQTAREIEPFPRRHPTVPPDPILGSKSISRVNGLVYPVHRGGRRVTGIICVDVGESGIHQDLRRTLVWIDIAPPDGPAVFRITEEFTIVASAGNGLAVLELLT